MKRSVSSVWTYFVIVVLFFVAIIWLLFSGISINTGLEDDKGVFSVAMVTDTGGINDRSFNTSSWEGMKAFAKRTGSKARYVESVQSSDYYTNIDKLGDEKVNLIFGIGFSLADTILRSSRVNPELNYAIVDYSYGENTPENVSGLVFRSEESSFMVGYIAGMTTKTNSVGFVGGIAGQVIGQFEYGYRAGVSYAAKKLNKDINVKVQYAESFSDSAKGKAIAIKMFYDGCDTVFHAAGGVGVGVIEGAKETNNFAIGVDMDQSYLAPNNVLTSAIKNVGKAVDIISTKFMNGDHIGGQTFSYGLKEGCVGIPENNPNLDKRIYEDVLKIQDEIIGGKIFVPYDSDTFSKYSQTI